jgi:glutamate dehydrogenase/leucine dehydrogenase/CBS domain-containing protein
MIPTQMNIFLREHLPETSWQNRLVREEGMCFMEFGIVDVDRLARLGIQVDSLGPRLVACLWDEESPLEVGGYLVVDNLAMGRPSIGGIRLLPDLTPSNVFYLARGMTLKNAAACLPYGGGKFGLIARQDFTPEKHAELMRHVARLLYRYRDIYLPGPDTGTNDADMKIIAIANGLDNVVSKPAEMGGNQVDQLGAGGGGLIIALQTLLEEMPRLNVLPQFYQLRVPPAEEIKIIFQGFGYVGANAANFLKHFIPGAKVAGISDTQGYLYNPNGLPVEELYSIFQKSRLITSRFYQERLASTLPGSTSIKFSTAPNDLLREDAFCMIPAAHVARYLDIDTSSNPSITIDRMGRWSVIIEGANTYSPDPVRRASRARMERAVYRERGTLIATDYLVNSGSVIFAAQEHLIKTPPHLEIPEDMLENQAAVNRWLAEHADEFQALAEKRRLAGEKQREWIIRNNMHEFIRLLVSDADMLPCEAAERISVGRIASRESDRTAADIMESIITIPLESTVRQAAKLLVEAGSPILVVVNTNGELAGVVTDWDITRATAIGSVEDMPLRKVMTRDAVTATPTDSILELVRKLEYHEISAMPVVDNGVAVGIVHTDLLSRRTLLRLLQSQAR